MAIRTDIDGLGPDVLATIHPDGLADIAGKLVVIALGQARADHAKGSEPGVLEMVEGFDSLAHKRSS